EILMVIALAGMVLSLSAGALRNFWLTQTLHGAREDAVAQLRQVQQRVISESHPKVWGVRFRLGQSEWGIVEFDPHSSTTTADDTCAEITPMSFNDGVKVKTVTFEAVTGITSLCRSQITGATSDEFAFFFARNTATEGTLALEHQSLPGKEVSLEVLPITGRVEEL
ncbi:MAG: pilus assembly FimT family protein, partial [Actinomycetota bacterium]